MYFVCLSTSNRKRGDDMRKKEAAHLATQAQEGRKENQSYVTTDFLVEVIARLTDITPRYKRLLKNDKSTLKYFLKQKLGLDLNDIQTDKNINSGFNT